MNANLHLTYNKDQKVQPSLTKMTFFEELYIDAKTESIENGHRIRIGIHPKQDVVINELCIHLSYSFQPSDEIFCNGFQSQTESLVYAPNESLPTLGSLAGNNWHQLGSYRHPHLKDLSANLHSWTYSHIRRADGSYFLIGSLSENTGFTIIKYCCNLNVIKITWEAHAFELSHSFPALDIVILEGKEEQLFDNYFQLMESKVKAPILTLRSGIAVETEVDADFLQEQVDTFGAQDIPLDLVMVREGYSMAMGDWLSRNGEAPKGIPASSATIQQAGLKAGIHLAPFLCSRDSDFYKSKKHCLLKASDGQLARIKHSAASGGHYYVLDYYNKEVTEYLNTLFSALTQQWSYDFISLDYLHVICLHPPANKTMGQVMCEALDFLRDLCGNTLLMASSVPIGAAFGRVAYCQLAAYPISAWKNSWLSWNKVRERTTALAAIPTQLNRRQVHNRIFGQAPSLLIPGHLISRFSINQQQTLMLINSLCGAGFIISNNGTTEASEEHISEFRQAIADQETLLKRVQKLGDWVYQIHFINNEKEWMAFINLQRSKTIVNTSGQSLQLEACESLVLRKN